MTHVSNEEIEKVKKLIEVLQMRQSLLSETTLISEDALCPICYAQQNGKQRKILKFQKLQKSLKVSKNSKSSESFKSFEKL
jgi:hypothetical protein